MGCSSTLENAISYVEGKNKYYGTKVTINVWEPKIHQQYEFIFSQIWLISDLFRKYINSIEAD
uniref:Neprosin PEP catalytic domain-containing protein n=1 Tax=Brassica oleracea var. oleracea TaxID=109376 RepID=A0A0D2ZUL4_BRAOL